MQRFYVPKFTTIEDRLQIPIIGGVTFKQVFGLFFAFILSYLFFRINPVFGIVSGIFLFGLAILLTFYYVNGKPLLSNLGLIIESFIKERKFVWKKIEKISYKKIEIPTIKEEEIKIAAPTIASRKERIIPVRVVKEEETPQQKKVQKIEESIVLEVTPTKGVPEVKEEVVVSLERPFAEQLEGIAKKYHQHLLNPKNPYRFFPYIKFYQLLSKKR